MRATETIDFERELPELVRELRSLPAAAPESVRQRVRALGEPSRPRVLVLRDRLASMRWRRTLLVLAPVCVAGVLGAALVHGLVSSGPSRQTAVWGAATSPSATHDKSLSLPEDRPVFSGAADSRRVIPQPSSGRYQDYEASLTVRVRDLDTLSDRTTEAMQAVRSLGGYVASVEQTTTAGRPGRADLVLRVPVARVQDAIARLAGLGTVTEQHLSIRDLNQLVAQQRQQILTLKLQIARLVNALRDSSLPADVRIR